MNGDAIDAIDLLPLLPLLLLIRTSNQFLICVKCVNGVLDDKANQHESYTSDIALNIYLNK